MSQIISRTRSTIARTINAARFARIAPANTAPRISPKTNVNSAARIAPIILLQELLIP